MEFEVDRSQTDNLYFTFHDLSLNTETWNSENRCYIAQIAKNLWSHEDLSHKL